MKYYNLDGTENTTDFSQTIPSSLIYANPTQGRGFSAEKPLTLSDLFRTLFTTGNKLNNMMNAGEGQILYIDQAHQYIPNVKLNQAFKKMFFSNSVPNDLLERFEVKNTLN
ncbi:UNVERIFIED_CONTAM: hypothetical protein O8I53_06205 [Campylobacter lari]